MTTRPILTAALLAAVPVAGCRSTRTATVSASPPAAVQVDGAHADWTGALRPFPGQKGVALGVRSDGRTLDVAVAITDEALARRAALGGLIVWLDPAGGREKRLGIRFPVGGPGGRPEGPGGGPGRPAMGDGRPDLSAASLTHFELLRDGEARGERVPVDGLAGVRVAAARDAGEFRYELRVALAAGTETFGVGVEPGGPVGLGLEAPVPERPGRGGRGEAFPEGGGRPGSGGRPGGGGPPGGGGGFPGGPPAGGRPGGPGGPEGGELKAWSVWTRVALADG